VQGIVILKPDPPFGLPIDADQWLYYFTLAVLLVMFWAAANLIRSRSGRAIMAIRDSPIAASAMGIDTALYKTVTFGVSALYTGVAGALGAIAVQFVAPDSFTFLLSISLLVAACALPFLLGNYRVFQLTLVWVYAIALLGLNMLTGYNGQISLGHGAFFAIGAYVAAILMDKLGLPYWATIPAAGAVCLVAGFLFGLPALRLEGLYLAVATLALAVATPQILKHKALEHWTGGVQGIVIIIGVLVVRPSGLFGKVHVVRV
jgi:ABC-type branched-subunit amino acid transport system permease subunit